MTSRTPRKSLIAAAICIAIGTTALAQQFGSVVAPEPQARLLADGHNDSLTVGQRIDTDRLHRIKRPGLYGISQSPSGSGYGVLNGRLIRYDPDTMQVQSVIREVDQILD